MLVWLLWFAAICFFLAGLYGFHRLCLYLEARGYMYYWHTKPQGSVPSVLVDLQEIMQPSVRHVIEVRNDKHVENDNAGDDPRTAKSGS